MNCKMLIAGLIAMTYSISGYSKEPNLNEIFFLLGCWQKVDGAETSEENWNKISDQKFQGKGKSLKNGKVVFWEDLEITTNGRIVYQPAPMGNKSVLFSFENRSINGEFKKAAFINMNHDFPQQIIYSSDPKSPGRLDIELKGVDEKSNPSGFKYSLSKIDCK